MLSAFFLTWRAAFKFGLGLLRCFLGIVTGSDSDSVFRRVVIRDMAQGFTGTAFDGWTVFAGMTRFVAVCTY